MYISVRENGFDVQGNGYYGTNLNRQSAMLMVEAIMKQEFIRGDHLNYEIDYDYREITRANYAWITVEVAKLHQAYKIAYLIRLDIEYKDVSKTLSKIRYCVEEKSKIRNSISNFAATCRANYDKEITKEYNKLIEKYPHHEILDSDISILAYLEEVSDRLMLNYYEFATPIHHDERGYQWYDMTGYRHFATC